VKARSFAVCALAAAACGGMPAEPPSPSASGPPLPATRRPETPAPVLSPAPTVDEARAFVVGVEDDLRRLWVARDRAAWVNQTYITEDTGASAAAAEEATAAAVQDAIVRARRFDPIRAQLPADVARKLYLLSTSQAVPAPRDAAKRRELASIESWMMSAYGQGQYCPPNGSSLTKYLKADKGKKEPCLHLEELSRVLAKSRIFEELVEAWRGWHASAAPIKGKYARYVELANEGAREIGFDDVGALWRSRFDMSPAELEADVERLWAEVEPLYEALHCWVRSRLQARYGKDKVPDRSPIPAQLLGNMWSQDWSDVYDLVVPYPHEPSLDVGPKLAAGKWDATKMVRQGERFFTGLGFDPLPPTFWERSQLVRPRDREVVCHASAWDVTWSGDLRVKMCIEPKPSEEDFVTIHHELGHVFYYQRYVSLPILFQGGANDGFQEAIGDTMALSVTPEYLAGLGLLDAAPNDDKARIDAQMKIALDKIAFLPFGLLVDRWRWGVMARAIAPDDYESAWWKLARKYQGVSAPVARTADDFDPGAKYHVASSTPYVPYFLARIYQFQFHKALCQAAGYAGPLDRCSIHDNRQAGAKLLAVLQLGASKPWADAMEALGAGRKADAGPLLEYFAPLRRWLEEHDNGLACGWR
jgi:peptidyl-dipeptidase A